MRASSSRQAVCLLAVLALSFSGFACECGSPGPACSYASSAPVIFVGAPTFTDDDGSGTFAQRTLYKFRVEEIFKGLPEGTKEIWVDPGSYTSCYAEYRLGEKLLVFASVLGLLPVDTAAMSVARPTGRPKPLPPGFDPMTQVYYAPECTGTREADSAANDIEWLRAWKAGGTQTSIQGSVHDWLDWPLAGAKVVVKSDRESRFATTDSTGAFLFEPIAPGKYDVDATLAGFRLRWKPQVDVHGRACGYLNISLEASGGLSGTLMDQNGRPLAGVTLGIARMKGTEETFPSVHRDESGSDGSFLYRGLPPGDYLIGVNLDEAPSMDTPYPKTYAPGVPNLAQARVFHLGPHQTISGIRMQIPARLRERTVNIRVVWPDGKSAGQGVSVEADDEKSSLIDFESTTEDGVAKVKCFATEPCVVEAKTWLKKPGDSAGPQVAASPKQRIEAGRDAISITLSLTERRDRFSVHGEGGLTHASESRPDPLTH